MSFRNALASVAVRDIAAAVTWYERLLGRPADSRQMADVAEWRFAGGGWLQVYHLPERAGNGSCTLAVDDIEAIAEHLRAMGVDVSQRSSGKAVKTLMVTDPDGNHLAFAEALEPNIAQ